MKRRDIIKGMASLPLLGLINPYHTRRLTVADAAIIVRQILKAIDPDSPYLPENAEKLYYATHENLNDNFLDSMKFAGQNPNKVKYLYICDILDLQFL
jgi:hypothetical protein